MKNPSDEDLDNIENGEGDDLSENSSSETHKIASVKEVDESLPDEAQFEEPVASPNVTGEENVFSGDAPEGEPADIDEELKKVGLAPDNFGEEE